MEYSSTIKKQKNDAISRNLDGSRDSHAKWSKSERERQTPYDITYIWNLMLGTDEILQRKEIQGHEEQTLVTKE